MAAKVTDADGNPVPGVTVTFTAPTSGPSATFPGSASTATAVTDATGVATAPTLTANNTVGSYTVTATAPDVSGTASFALTNIPNQATLVLTLTAQVDKTGLLTRTVTFTLVLTNQGPGPATAPNVTLQITRAPLTFLSPSATPTPTSVDTRLLSITFTWNNIPPTLTAGQSTTYTVTGVSPVWSVLTADATATATPFTNTATARTTLIVK